MDLGDVCEIGLGLGLGSHNHFQQSDDYQQNNKKRQSLKCDDDLVPSLTLGPSGEGRSRGSCGESTDPLQPQASSFSAGVSSFSNSSSVKRDRDDLGGEETEAHEIEVERVISSADQDDEEVSPRKKLRLTKQQSATLEDSFQHHTTLNPVNTIFFS